MGTLADNDLQKSEPSNLSANLSGERQAWQALAQAGALIQAAANAMLGVAGRSVTHRAPVLPFPGQLENYTVMECVKEFLGAKARSGRSDRYLQALRVSLKSFAHGRANTALVDVTIADIEKWLEKSDWAPRTKRGYLSDVRTMYNFAVKRGLARTNPGAAIELPVLSDSPVEIHTPEQVKKALELARSRDLNVCRCLAIRYFAGLRSSEAMRLHESEIKETFIEVTAAKSKTRRRRIVTISPNLKAWLALGGVLPLHDVSQRMRTFTAALRQKHAIEWPHNVTRHSFVSYHLAEHQSAAKTALEAGHTEQMLFAHYREVVTPQAAKDYWAIVPD